MVNRGVLFHRHCATNKGDYGHVFILAGSMGFTGAAVLCAQSAMRTGAGLVTLGIPKSLNTIVARRILEVMTRPLPETPQRTLSMKGYSEIAKFAKKTDVLAVGPGLSRNISTRRLIRKVISNIDTPMVIDADGLNALTGYLDILRKAYRAGRIAILTPHPGEFSRLINKSVDYVQKNRQSLAKSFAHFYNVVLVLKGHRTLVAEPQGGVYFNKTGNPGMATAGTGDVLTGMIAALLGQGYDGFNAAKFAVQLHGLAGDLAAKEKTQAGMIASDIIEQIPDAIKRCS